MNTMRTAALLGALLAFSSPAAAEENEGPLTTITTNPVGLVDGRINLEVEHAINRRVSAYGGLNFLVLEPQFDANERIFGIGPELGLRLYFLGSAPEGLFIGPTLELAYLYDDDESDFGIGVGGMLGFTWIMFDIFTLSAGVGVAYQDMVVEFEDRDDAGQKAVVPKFRFAIGVAF